MPSCPSARRSLHRPILAFFASVAITTCFVSSAMAAAPDWVEQNGFSEAHPAKRFLIGFAQTTGKEDAVEAAKQQAAADLARQVSVQIESNVVDVLQERQGKIENELTSQIRATSDVRL